MRKKTMNKVFFVTLFILFICNINGYEKIIRQPITQINNGEINVQYLTGGYKVYSITGTEKIYNDIKFEKIKNSSDIKISICSDQEKTEFIKEKEKSTIKKIYDYITFWDEYTNTEMIKYDYYVPDKLKTTNPKKQLTRKLIKSNKKDKEINKFKTGDKYCFEQISNPKKEPYIKIGNNSIIIIAEEDVISNSYTINSTIENDYIHMNIIDDDIIAYWSFDKDLSDYTNNNYDGSLYGGANYYSNGYIGGAYEFDGTSDGIIINDLVIDVHNDFSGSLWVYPTGADGTFISSRIDDNNGIRGFWNNDGTLAINVKEGGTVNVKSKSGISANEWNHIVFSWDNSTNNLTMKVNNADPDGTSAPWYLGATNTDLTIGCRLDDSMCFPGLIDEVMIFNTTLNSTEMTNIYNTQDDKFPNNSTIEIPQFNITNIENADSVVIENIDTQEYNNSNVKARIGQWRKEYGYNTDIIDNLIAYYPLDDNATDYVGSNDGTVTGATLIDNGKLGGAYTFDGVDDYINFGTDPLIENELTISIWVKLINVSQSGNIIGYHGSSYSVRRWSLGYNNYGTSTFNLHLWNSSEDNTKIVLNAGGIVDSNQWYHVVGTYEPINGNAKIYVNGVLKNTQILEGLTFLPHNTLSLKMGVDIGSYFDYLEATIDEVMIFNKTLTEEEIQMLYVKGIPNWNYTDYQNYTDDVYFEIEKNTTNILPSFLLESNENKSYSPIIYGNQTYNIYNNLLYDMKFILRENGGLIIDNNSQVIMK